MYCRRPVRWVNYNIPGVCKNDKKSDRRGDEGGYVLSYPDLPGCMTCSDSLDDLLELAKDAKETWILGMLEDGKEIPLPSDLQSYSGQFKLRIPKSLHRSLSIHAKEEGISMNQYCLYLLAKNDTEYKKERR